MPHLLCLLQSPAVLPVAAADAACSNYVGVGIGVTRMVTQLHCSWDVLGLCDTRRCLNWGRHLAWGGYGQCNNTVVVEWSWGWFSQWRSFEVEKLSYALPDMADMAASTGRANPVPQLVQGTCVG